VCFFAEPALFVHPLRSLIGKIVLQVHRQGVWVPHQLQRDNARNKILKNIDEMRVHLESYFYSKEMKFYEQGMATLRTRWQKVLDGNCTKDGIKLHFFPSNAQVLCQRILFVLQEAKLDPWLLASFTRFCCGVCAGHNDSEIAMINPASSTKHFSPSDGQQLSKRRLV
ncbi:hypothetical protein NECAME_16288, partial [Necator americanus]